MVIIRFFPGTEDTVLMADVIAELDRSAPHVEEFCWGSVLIDGDPFVVVGAC